MRITHPELVHRTMARYLPASASRSGSGMLRTRGPNYTFLRAVSQGNKAWSWHTPPRYRKDSKSEPIS